MNEEFENLFRKLCWNCQIDADSSLDSGIYRKFAEKFYELGLEHGQKQNI